MVIKFNNSIITLETVAVGDNYSFAVAAAAERTVAVGHPLETPHY